MLRGRPERLWLLDHGEFRVHDGGAGRLIGILGLLIETDRGERVLVDGGFPPHYAADPEAPRRELGRFGTVERLGPGNTAEGQVALVGGGPPALLVLTHSHVDHLGALGAFLPAPVVLGAAERALPRPLYWEDHPMGWPDRAYVALDGDASLGPGLTVLTVPGHTPGQLALLIEGPSTGRVLWTSDAVSRPGETHEDAWDPPLARRSAERLAALAEGCDLVVWGHCPEQWPRLPKAPDLLAGAPAPP